MPYEAKLPDDVKLPDGHRVNVDHADHKALEALAREEGWSQKSFSRVLGLEAKRTMAKAAAAAPAPAPAPAPARPFSSLSTAEKFAHSLSLSKGRG
jgi:hypothetical protein